MSKNHKEAIKRLKWLRDDLEDEAIAMGCPSYHCGKINCLNNKIDELEEKLKEK